MRTRVSSESLRYPLLFVLFFISGFAALVYQTAWHRLLGLFAGADTIAASLVVGAFLLGLGIGSLVGGLVADRLSRRTALLAFAVCEVGIAIFAVISPWLYYDVLYRHLLPISSSSGVIFLVVFVGLLWPTFLMGCSLPLLSKAIVQRIEGAAGLIGWLYGVNTFGAAAGAFVGGWFLIGTVGFDKAVYVGALLNLIVAAGGLLLALRLNPSAESRPDIGMGRGSRHDMVVVRWAALVFVSGFMIVALQIVWYRLIGVMLQSNAYSFSLVLSVFLLGDAVGLLVGSRIIASIVDPRRFFFLMQGLATAFALAGAWLLYLAIDWGLLPSSYIDHDFMSGTLRDTIVVGGLLSLVVLPASFVMGFSFPVVQKAVQRDTEHLGSRVGYVQLANIIGNSAGSLVAGLALLDHFGTVGTLKILTVVGLIFALVPLLRADRPRWGYAPLAVLAAGLALFPDGEKFWQKLHGVKSQPAMVAEDKTGLTVLKMSNDQDGKLYIQGQTQSKVPFDTIHLFLGAIGPLTHPAPKRVLVIGSGTGGTPYAAGLHPSTERVRVIEIVQPVLDILRRYAGNGGDSGINTLLTDPKFEILIADGRHTLALDHTLFDIIEADAIYPKAALSGILNSQEFFRQVQSKLAPGGIYVQWAPTSRAIETFRSVFPHVVLVAPALLGSDRPIPYSTANVLTMLAEPSIEAALDAARIDATELHKWFSNTKAEILNDGLIMPASSPNTDFFPRDEYYLNR